jgi:hypothetical protein
MLRTKQRILSAVREEASLDDWILPIPGDVSLEFLQLVFLYLSQYG